MSQPQHLRHRAQTVEGELSLSTVSKCLVAAVGAIIACYVLALLVGLPQHATELIVDEQAATAAAGSAETTHPAADKIEPPPLFMVVPFVLMLGAIAIMPLLPGTKRWWESNLHRLYVAGGLALVTILYYA